MPIEAHSILELWFADAAGDPARAAAREGIWFGASLEMDAAIRDEFGAAIDAAARGELDSWARTPRSALALVVLLDQFPRNVWRGTARAFAQDARALATARGSVAAGHLGALAPVEQAFLILPYEHSESIAAQRECVQISERIARTAAPEWRPLLEHYTEYARQHLALIEQFGRFPHRNAVLGRESTPEERAYLSGGGATFGQAAKTH